MTLAALIDAIERHADAIGISHDQLMEMEVAAVNITRRSSDVAISVIHVGKGEGRLYLDRAETIPAIAVLGVIKEGHHG